MSPTDRRPQPNDGGNTAKLAAASGVSVPPLTVFLGSAMYTFPINRDVVVGRGRECDICFHDINPEDLTLISRVHAILRFDGDHWVIVDKSQNGIFVAGVRSNVIPVRDRLSIALGGPRGPELSFRVQAPATPFPTGGDDSPATEQFRPVGPPAPAGRPPATGQPPVATGVRLRPLSRAPTP